ncbi:shikimate kinase [Vagococcus intermedius]|uniref:Shikimate kinase n=1 Tax=Vagococcus intermedius TaxID=2991418 RepID=A0AAF0I8H5_9ENTE|nr:shikimate kinase [Vagococcus intermedius]WEG74159.1 shikimate kinase [Vagococcus intermedius]WEG76239.1 shikimate kinase [Vagococcus intermedius]
MNKVNIVLVGFMASGKTTIGRRLSEITQQTFFDTDDYLVNKFEISIPEFFDVFGEELFREAETSILKDLLKYAPIISTGGGIILKSVNRKLLKESGHVVVFLDATFEAIQIRLISDKNNTRPLASVSQMAQLKERYEMRQSYYQEVADLVIDTTGKTPTEVVSEIEFFLKKSNA